MTKKIKKLFTEHTTEVGTFVTVLIHAILPFAFVNTSRDSIKDILIILNRNGDER